MQNSKAGLQGQCFTPPHLLKIFTYTGFVPKKSRFIHPVILMVLLIFIHLNSNMGQGCMIPTPSNLISQGSFETPSSSPCLVAPGVTLDGGINSGCLNPLFASNGCINNKAFFQPLSLYRSAKYRLSYYARNIEKTYGTLPASLLLNPGQIFQYAFGNLYYQMPLSITKTYTEDQVTHILTFQIEVTNNQNIIANNIVVTDVLANTLNLVNANGFTVNSNTLTQLVNGCNSHLMYI